MKLTLFLTIALSALLFIATSRNASPYFNKNKSHHTKFGFRNPYLKPDAEKKKLRDLFKMMASDRPKSSHRLSGKINVDELNRKIFDGENFITWVGHSTMLLNLNGKVIITDPMFSERCSPIQFVGPKRYTSPSIGIKTLPKVDIVVISHNHYDHLDKNTVKLLKNDSSTVWYVPLGLKPWLAKVGVQNVIELDWYEDHNNSEFDIVCLPSQHWSKRSLFKSFDTLWASWLIKIGNYKFWFAGDTGYNRIQFREIGDKYGPIDIAAIPIGAYEPRWFMKNFHVQPEESIFIHKDIKSKKSIGMHFGTFVLTTEPLDEPESRIKKIISEDQLINDQFIIPEHGKFYDL